MTPVALALVLAAAGAHATWNYLAKTARGGLAFAAVFAAWDVLLVAPFAVAALAVDGAPAAATALPFMAVSGVLHAGYFLLLQRGYRDGDLSLVYPLARGTGPLLATVVAIAALGERPSALALAGGATIVAALVVLAAPWRGERAAVWFALGTGVFIAAYTIWDKQAVDAEALSPLVYYWGSSLVRASLLAGLARGRGLGEAWRGERGRAVAAAGLSSFAYLLVLYALTLAPVSYVAPAREVSVLVGAALGVQLLAERDARRRLLCAAAVAVGIIGLALG